MLSSTDEDGTVCVGDEADVLLIIFLHDGHNNAKDSCHRAPWIIRRGALLIAPHVRGSNNKLSCCAPVLSFDLWTSSKYCVMYCVNTAMVVQYTEG